jgi:hypothetical protein
LILLFINKFINLEVGQLIGKSKGNINGVRDIMVSKIGVLLKSKESGEQIGVLEFDLSGMLMCQMIKKGLHVFALRSVIHILNEKDPLPIYRKYADQKDEEGHIPREILRKEAASYAKILNEAEMEISGIPVTASVVEWEEADRESK